MTRFKWFQRTGQAVDYVAGEPTPTRNGQGAHARIGRAAAPTPQLWPLMARVGAGRPAQAIKRLDQS
ncbi:hypothetical protein [Micromonospora sp. WMMD712]|uniref:hypothetical protein n=1 Tax=Micromonospora sp. WMMD712 TaxID=3016096 RepID=UPI00249ABB0C|nr:hypothetical protein [Micromonospora sp. WMMD712]WFE57325.1 hypothetical protein O7633_10775 [Micromonospora sp. WMMD712]